ncbi:ribosomal protein S18-alanine N-acetyltransferase [Xylella fastidiosa]|uniref:ribosomal protein S18-alanine N-acetyltransferase n=1 Tax=Xylella fastidiosa TaxID=2371 RepID=UPI001195CDE1|nr:ribosomal protein S18-alanine N-acetyltransferase [Xylella fastidiosa]MBS9444710.1 ribosomal protein S18-alanine N-acetyltransferase [Xylella fastidiosa subsp. multiplex]MBS9447217.1 ribosomal protein S18-alanine N-acetyltransferase [Xylella fastidiosa subsp. multiplex]MBS9449321.1 ribosomal protein S18-alanine N-acetyltransferase [Xylella fastidiosa subsp. multiplex]MBS9450730.1 ribosomal protein S18-alanine N-acetyltransferase [Xylella fastidiosa subsp. multiplex]MBS9485539.1 ribosomal pr
MNTLKTSPLPVRLCTLGESHLDKVMEIERRVYCFPWTRAIFRNCFQSGHLALLMKQGRNIIGYGIVNITRKEAHLLNICIAPEQQSHGLGRSLLRTLIKLSCNSGAQCMFLEVRPSNTVAIALYHSEGFNEIDRHRHYYPAQNGYEDALVMGIEFS